MRKLLLFMFGTPILLTVGIAFFICSFEAIVGLTLEPYNLFEWEVLSRKLFAITWACIQCAMLAAWLDSY